MEFMAFMIFYYEEFLHHNNYTRSRFITNQTLGFSALAVLRRLFVARLSRGAYPDTLKPDAFSAPGPSPWSE